MQLNIEDLPDGVTKAALAGRMDIDGANSVDLHFNVLAGSKRALVVDLSEVSFIASMGLRTLMTCARAIASKGGKMALAAPQENVLKVLTTSGVGEIVAIRPTLTEAVAYVAG